MGGDVLGQTAKQHTEVGSLRFQGWIEGESSIAQAEKGEQKEDDIGNDASCAILAEKAIGYVDEPILGIPPSKSLFQPHCGNQAGWMGY